MADLLRTDYKDDILNTEVNTQRKYRMVENGDGTVSFEDVTAYAQVGDNFGSADINKTNLAIDELNNALESAFGLSYRILNGTVAVNTTDNAGIGGYKGVLALSNFSEILVSNNYETTDTVIAYIPISCVNASNNSQLGVAQKVSSSIRVNAGANANYTTNILELCSK